MLEQDGRSVIANHRSIYAIIGGKLCLIDPVSLDRSVISSLKCWLELATSIQRQRIMVANGPNLYTLEPSLQDLRAAGSRAFLAQCSASRCERGADRRAARGVFLLELIDPIGGLGGTRLLLRAPAWIPCSGPGRFVRSATAVNHRFTCSITVNIPSGITAVTMRLTDPNNLWTELTASF
jgi:hypothetical protein